MTYYLVKPNQVLSNQASAIYYDCIEKIGYQRTTCHLRVPQEDGSVNLKNAEGGLLETQAEANALLHYLITLLPTYAWQIVPVNHTEKISWYRK